MQQVTLTNAQCLDKEHVLKYLENSKVEVLLTLGAGDIDRLVQPIKAYYSE